MKKIFSLVALSILSVCLFAQQPINDPNVEKRTVSGFTGIEVGTGIELLLTQDNVEEVAVSAATNEFRDKIVTKVESGVLKIHYESKTGSVNKRKQPKKLKAYVSCKTLSKLHASTGAVVMIKGTLQSADLDMDASTGAEIKGNITAGDLSLNQSTGSKVELSGTSKKMNIKGDTGSKFIGENMEVESCNVSVNTGAKISISAGKELQAKASTGGVIKYKGNASIREIKTNTGGSVSKI
jgi:hypothetical protein